MDRPPRKPGGKASRRGIGMQCDCILVARDRNRQTCDFVTGRGRGALSIAGRIHAALSRVSPLTVQRLARFTADSRNPSHAIQAGAEEAVRHAVFS
ncbi:hypothetical protein [Pseudoduganella umbonata]|uniref:Uncharacterized protein n=1 Tax=Pseudoduganella umbonata TaxID=864828 RepID=A0A7W5EBF9_9BURK|nr:hypothetical protein [Pseudoduganella umbonata]